MRQITPDRSPPNVVRVELCGEFDLSDKDRLTALLRPAESADLAIIDMRETTYIDSTALACLIRLKKHMGAWNGGAIHLIGVRPSIRKLFEITQLDELFDVSS